MTSSTPASFLLAQPRGTYTCMRVGKDGKLVDVEANVARLNFGVQVMFNTQRDVRLLMQSVLTRKYSPGLLVILITDTTEHVAFFPSSSSPVVAVGPLHETYSVLLGGGHPRLPYPNVKDSQWIRTRAPLEMLKREFAVDEVILSSNEGELCEGLTTNFFIVRKDGIVETAPDHAVLCGTMRERVLRACEDLEIPVILSCPRMDDWDTWEAAFLTSVTRPCTTIVQCIRFSDKSRKTLSERDNQVERIRRRVMEMT